MITLFGFMVGTQGLGVAPQITYPVADGATNEWTAKTGSDRYAMVDDVTADDGTTYIKSGSTIDQKDQILLLHPLVEPDDHTQTKIHVRYRREGHPAATIRLRVLLNGETWTQTVPNDEDWHDWTITLTAVQSAALSWGSQFSLTLRKLASTYAREIYVTQVNLTTEQ